MTELRLTFYISDRTKFYSLEFSFMSRNNQNSTYFKLLMYLHDRSDKVGIEEERDMKQKCNCLDDDSQFGLCTGLRTQVFDGLSENKQLIPSNH